MKRTFLLALVPAVLACDQLSMRSVERDHLAVQALGPTDPRSVLEKLERVHRGSEEHPNDAPSGAALAWEHEGELENDGRLYFAALNLEEEERDFEVTAIGDRATLVSRQIGPRAQLRVPPKAAVRLVVELDRRLIEEMEYSGFLALHVSSCPTVQEEVNCRVAVSAPMFFHPTEKNIAVYGEDILLSKYRSGDFRGTGPVEPGTLRVMGGGPLHTPPPVEKDEVVPVEVNIPAQGWEVVQ